MERQNQEPTPKLDIDKALWQVREDQMLQFTPNGFRLYEYIETDDTSEHTVAAGESEHTYKFPVKKLVLQKEVSDLATLFNDNERSQQEYSDFMNRSIEAPEFKAWAETIVVPEDLKETAMNEMKRRMVEGTQETIPCSNCKGQAHFEVACSCTHGGSTFVDMTDESGNSNTALREEGEADPLCDTCDGSGKKISDCPNCEGCGKAAKYPLIILKNEATGEDRIVDLDIAMLLANDEIEAKWSSREQVFSDNFQSCEKTLRLNISEYIDKNMAAIGIDKENAARVDGNLIRAIESEQADVSLSAVSWKIQNGEIIVRSSYDLKDTPTLEMINNAQHAIARAYAWPYGKIKNHEGVVVAEEWTLRQLQPAEATLDELKTAVGEVGYSLGYSLSFIETGQVGPSFYIVDDHGNALVQLSNDYSVRESIENALLSFQKIKENSQKREDEEK